MENYKVIALYVGGKNKVFTSGDIVTQDNFETNVEGLIEQGFLVTLGGKKTPKKEQKVAVKVIETVEETTEETVEETTPVFVKMDSEKVFKIEDCTANEIKTELTLRGVNFDVRANKTALWALLA